MPTPDSLPGSWAVGRVASGYNHGGKGSYGGWGGRIPERGRVAGGAGRPQKGRVKVMGGVQS